MYGVVLALNSCGPRLALLSPGIWWPGSMRLHCEEVSRVSGADADVVVAAGKTVAWVRYTRSAKAIPTVRRSLARRAPQPAPPDAKSSYTPMLKQIVKFFQTGTPPVSNEETLEIFAFMDAAQKSKEQEGKAVKLR